MWVGVGVQMGVCLWIYVVDCGKMCVKRWMWGGGGGELVCSYMSSYMWLYLLEGEKKSFFIELM